MVWRVRRAALAVALATAAAAPAWAQDAPGDATESSVERRLREQAEEIRELRKEIEGLKRREAEREGKGTGTGTGTGTEEGKRLQEEFERELKAEPAPAAAPAAPAPMASAGPLKLIDVGFDILADVATSTAREKEMRRLQFGDHDPKSRGFTLPNAELTLAGVVDPYFRGDAAIVFKIAQDGESELELEEAYFTTLALPYGLQAIGGQLFNRFGRQNHIHPHAWEFVDQPVVLSRMFGPDGLRGPGAQLSWLAPTPFYLELIGGAMDSVGDIAFSFRNVPGETFGGRPEEERDVRALEDLVWLARAKTSFDLTDELTIVPGLSALFGPNATGRGTDTLIAGADLYVKWKPLSNDHGWPFVAFTAEYLQRRFETPSAFAVLEGDIPSFLGQQALHDRGLYAQVSVGFTRPWVAGVRYEWADGDRDEARKDFLRDARTRVSPDLTYYFSEFAKARIQYNYDHAEHLNHDEHSFMLQLEILYGAHAAHKF